MSRSTGGVQPSVRPAGTGDEPARSADPDDTRAHGPAVAHGPPVPNGAAPSEAVPNGAVPNGAVPNGAAPNGAAVPNGHRADGAGPPGGPAPRNGHPAGGHPAGGPSASNGAHRPEGTSSPLGRPRMPARIRPDEARPGPDPAIGRRARRSAPSGEGSHWVQDEIRRRMNGSSGTSGRHARVEPSAPGPGAGPGDPGDPPAASTEAAPTGPRPRPRSPLVPDPYAPDGIRPPGPADGTARPSPGAPAELPRRVPGASSWPGTTRWPRGGVAPAAPAAPAADPDAVAATGPAAPVRPRPEAPPETRPVPIRWTASGQRVPAVPDVDDPEPASAGPAAPVAHPVGSAGPSVPIDLDELEDFDDLEEFDDADDDDRVAVTGPFADLGTARPGAAEDDETQVIWRSPDLDTAPAAGADRAGDAVAAPADDPSPADDIPSTGARPRAFAAAPTDARPLSASDSDDPGGGRIRVVLSERRSTTHSSRGLSDVQDPGAVGTLLRNTLVRNQLALSLRVCIVALVGLGLPPALFLAFPVIGEISVLGIRLPWLLLGGLVYPFLLLLAWWYVNSAESVEQEFAEGVTDR